MSSPGPTPHPKPVTAPNAQKGRYLTQEIAAFLIAARNRTNAAKPTQLNLIQLDQAPTRPTTNPANYQPGQLPTRPTTNPANYQLDQPLTRPTQPLRSNLTASLKLNRFAHTQPPPSASATGNRISTTSPPSTAFTAFTHPPCNRTARSVIASPTPYPPVDLCRDRSSR